LRQHGVRNHRLCLDDVMRALWVRCQAGPMQEADVLAVLQELTGRSWAPEFKAWVHGTRELPLEKLLVSHGVAVHKDPAQLAQRLGLRVSEDHSVQTSKCSTAALPTTPVLRRVMNGWVWKWVANTHQRGA